MLVMLKVCQMMVFQPPFDVLVSTETARPRAQSIDGFVSRMFQTCSTQSEQFTTVAVFTYQSLIRFRLPRPCFA
jgi:hypothetical protein